MVKGRNTTMVGARIADPIAKQVKANAEREGLTVSEYIGRAIKEYLQGREPNA